MIQLFNVRNQVCRKIRKLRKMRDELHKDSVMRDYYNVACKNILEFYIVTGRLWKYTDY